MKCNDEKCDYCKHRPKKHIPHKWGFIDGKEGLCGETQNNEKANDGK